VNREDLAMIEVTGDAVAPEYREKDGATGTPAVLADGREWLLADGGLCNVLDAIRDRIDDEARLRGEVDMADVRQAAFLLLRANYVLSEGEAASLLLGAEPQPLTDAVSRALFGEPNPRRTFTVWAASSLLANGIDPASVPGPLRQHVLDILVASRRTVPAGEFIESAEAARRRAAILARVRSPEAPPAPAGAAT
jgi:hypothetical protein